MDLQNNEHHSTWFLEMNPRGEVPAMKFGPGRVISDSTRIIHHLEAHVPVDTHPALVPCTSDTRMYQKHVYFVAQLDSVNYYLRSLCVVVHTYVRT